MTREKKELLKKMHELEAFIEADKELSCGCYPDDAYDGLEEELHGLYEKMAGLCHFDSVMDWMMDDRWLEAKMNGR